MEHYTDEQKLTIIQAYPPHEREARTLGIPMLGSGRVYPVPEELIKEDPISEIPPHWKQIIGMDFGWDHPTAGARILYDDTNDCIHISAAYRQGEASPLIHASAIKAWGVGIPVAWPHDALQHDKKGDQFYAIYRDHGLAMLSEHAQFPDKRGNSVEAGLMEILDRMQTGRFKVDRYLTSWWEEFRMYHRKDGKIVKERDDLMDATRYGVMMLRYATSQQEIEQMKLGDRYGKQRDTTGASWMSA